MNTERTETYTLGLNFGKYDDPAHLVVHAVRDDAGTQRHGDIPLTTATSIEDIHRFIIRNGLDGLPAFYAWGEHCIVTTEMRDEILRERQRG
jgi:hypothetical protein